MQLNNWQNTSIFFIDVLTFVMVSIYSLEQGLINWILNSVAGVVMMTVFFTIIFAIQNWLFENMTWFKGKVKF